MTHDNKKVIICRMNADCNEVHYAVDNNIIIVIYLYYLGNLDYYANIIFDLPCDLNVIICSSRQEVLDFFQTLGREKISLILKENRGRDLSALLIELREIILEGDIICFLHDKKSHHSVISEDTEIWSNNICENMIGGKHYIEQIIRRFGDDPSLGILFPPEPIGEQNMTWYSDTWLDNKNNTIEVCKMIGINDDSLFNEPPIGVGSAFWARVDAIRKIYDKDWKYEDFPEEPMPNDGTISHAIERSFEYIAKASGYRCATVMTDRYASWLLETSQKYCRAMFAQLKKREDVFCMKHVVDLDEREERILKYIKMHERVFVYGAGEYGKGMKHFLQKRGIIIDGFVVTYLEHKDDIDETPMYSVDEIKLGTNDGILIAVDRMKRQEIENELKARGIKDYLYAY